MYPLTGRAFRMCQKQVKSLKKKMGKDADELVIKTRSHIPKQFSVSVSFHYN